MKNEPFVTLLTTLLCVDAANATVEGLVAALEELTPAELAALLAALCPPPADLGTASDYGLLGATTITNTNNTVADGDLGLSPGTSVTGFPPGIVLGTQHITDAAAAAAQVEADAAYNALVALNPGTLISGDQGGVTLTPGVYSSATTLAITSGDLFLDAGGDPCATFVINVGSALTTGASRKVVLINGTQAKNVFWTMGTSATLGAGSVFRGTLIAAASITAVSEAFVQGRLFALTGAVTLDQNIIELPV